MATNGFKRAAQLRKAHALVSRIDRELLDAGTNPYDQAGKILLSSLDWSAATWASLAERAGVNPPSAETIEIVRSTYRDRASEPLDPFARFAS